MSMTSFDPEDPRLTAYALGELADPAERAEVETLLQDSPEARQTLKEIQDLTAALAAEYDQERCTALVGDFAAGFTDVLAPNVIQPLRFVPANRRNWSRPWFAAAAALLALGAVAALSLLVFNSTQQRNARTSMQRQELAANAAAAAPRSPDVSILLKDNPAEKLAQLEHPLQTPEPAQIDKVAEAPLAILSPTPTPSLFLGREDDPAAKLAQLEQPAQWQNRFVNGRKVQLFPNEFYCTDAVKILANPLSSIPPFSIAQSAKGEMQAYQGHPATISLSPIFGYTGEISDQSDNQSAAKSAQVAVDAVPMASENGVQVASTPSSLHGFAYQPVPTKVTRATLPAPQAVPQGASPAIPTLPDGASSMMLGSIPSGAANGMGGTGGGSGGRGESGGSGGLSSFGKRTSMGALAANGAVAVDSAQRRPKSEGDFAETRARLLSQVTTEWTNPVPRRAVTRDPRTGKVSEEAIVAFKYPIQFQPQPTSQDSSGAAYDHLVENPFLPAKDNPLSTFSIDVDTASYANVRRFIDSGRLPPPDAVRLEELINYFPYDYAPPTPESGQPFAVHLEAAACPWAPEHRLVRIGIKGKEIAVDKRPPSNLVFLLDVSGSMAPPERLPLIKQAMKLLVEQLTANDHVAIVVYAGNSGLVLPSTSGEHKDIILTALDRLEAGGSTNGASGITLAYQVAKENFIKDGTNRVLLATDGDFNVGMTNQDELVRLIEAEARGGVFLSALGVGTDNFKDSTMQKLADKGNGNYNYLDRLDEARKVLVEQMSGTLLTIAKDVKIQVEFNPAVVGSYRLIGYEKRMLRKEDFNNDRIDAGEIGAGHSVTALYEVVPVGQPVPGETPGVDPLKYAGMSAPGPVPIPPVTADAAKPTSSVASTEMLTVKLRHKAPDADTSVRSYEQALIDPGTPDDFAKASPDFQFAAAVATFGLSLRDSPYKGNATLGAAVEIAQEGKGTDPKGYRAGFIELARHAQALRDAPGGR